MIDRSFKDADMQLLWDTGKTSAFLQICATSPPVSWRYCMRQEALRDLLVPPGNRLEALSKDRAGQHALRINDQSRLCFVWRDGNGFDVETVDYQ